MSREIRADGSEPTEYDSDVEAAIREDHPALITYITAGDPSLEDTKAYVEALDRGGSDLIELGLPFFGADRGRTDDSGRDQPRARGRDDPAGFFELVDDLETEAPLLVMTYYNMILQFGDEPDVRPFVERAAEAGLSGIIVPDLPAEEADPLREACDANGLDLVFIIAPTTEGERLDAIMSQVSGFAYVQARLGTTGARANVSGATHDSLARLSEYDVPKAVGFGVSKGDHAAEIIEAGADGVIVGSALVDILSLERDARGGGRRTRGESP